MPLCLFTCRSSEITWCGFILFDFVLLMVWYSLHLPEEWILSLSFFFHMDGLRGCRPQNATGKLGVFFLIFYLFILQRWLLSGWFSSLEPPRKYLYDLLLLAYVLVYMFLVSFFFFGLTCLLLYFSWRTLLWKIKVSFRCCFFYLIFFRSNTTTFIQSKMQRKMISMEIP